MENLKSWKTTVFGVIALIGLGYETYVSGNFDVSKFLLLLTGLGLIFVAKDSKKDEEEESNLQSRTIDPNKDKVPDEKG